MKGMRSFFCVCALVVVLVAGDAKQCSMDFECGSYSLCAGGINDCTGTGHGLGVDSSDEEVYFTQTCRTEGSESNVTIKKVSAYCGDPEAVHSQAQNNETNPDTLFDVVGGALYYSVTQANGSHVLFALNLATLKENSVETGGEFQNAIEFDTRNDETFVCNRFRAGSSLNFTIDRFEGFLGQDDVDASEGKMMYNLKDAECTAIRKQAGRGNDLYFSTYELMRGKSSYVAKLLRGSTSCTGCKTPPAIVFSINNERIVDFDVTSNNIYYSTLRGVFVCDLYGEGTKRISNTGASSVRVIDDKVFWNSGTSVMSSDLDGDNLEQVNKVAGTCQCRKGFSGENCESCDGDIQRVNGRPQCVPRKPDSDESDHSSESKDDSDSE